jgi:Gluconate 2-dehydrogenase subunit 3
MADAPWKNKTSRRTVLLGLSCVCLPVSVLRLSGYPAVAATRAILSEAQWAILSAIASRMLASDGSAAPGPVELGVMGFIDTYLASMEPALRVDLLRFVSVIEHLMPLAHRYRRRFTELAATEQDLVLRGLETHSVGLVRGGFQGLKSLVMMAYYRHPKTWAQLGYEGPLVGRAL